MTHIDRDLSQHLGLTYREFQALTLFSRHSHMSSRRRWLPEISVVVGLSQSATSRLIDRLDDRGLISKRVGLRDRRSFDVRLSGEARELLHRAAPILHEAVRSAVASSVPLLADSPFIRCLVEQLDVETGPAAGT
ncbi:MarR family transcriptional regulator [Streptomyces sp. E5N91]|uniref:MarR family winged helix-turn-helix transcriptional regulator n=1 Tax=Streptomyces sp. E5N91 TaxID=1851996 RepID=UPI00187D1017|nr:MarR family transcriptional regulator [Streptomyces sp. E5N91]